ncbi:MAG: ATP synthase F1 subunit gamma [Patescibacteria group bacterium]
MPNARAIKQRIKSAKNISKITKAMEMVSASKMRKSQQQAMSSRPYAVELQTILQKISQFTDSTAHPLLTKESEGKDLMVVVSTDRGLVAGLNSNLFRAVLQWRESHPNSVFISVGKKAKQFISRMGFELYADFSPFVDAISYRDSLPMSSLVMKAFLNHEFKSVYVAHMQLINTLSQQPVLDQLLPLSPIKIENKAEIEQVSKEYIFEPSANEVLNWLLPYYVENTVYFTLLESKASEHSARMISMKNASDNAKDIVNVLSLEYNRSRQASITRELQEITTAQMSL